MPEPPHLPPLDAEEKRLHSEPLSDERDPHVIAKGKPGHIAEETHLDRSRFFGQDPHHVTSGESGNIDRLLRVMTI